MNEKLERFKKILIENRFMTIACVSPSNKPWATPVFFAFDDDFNLYWVSNKEARHSKNIRENSSISIAIFDSNAGEGEGECIYLEAKATELSNQRAIEQGIEVFDTRAAKKEHKVQNTENVLGDKAWRMYRATISKAYLSGDGEDVDGQHVDTREEVSLG